mmetsp:Transcript_5579/g.7318  ORF Transcript_5579/g.7318 Transcript_5579/m.7318 type:complete len:84 (-) Transcript_5579:330-581(-)
MIVSSCAQWVPLGIWTDRKILIISTGSIKVSGGIVDPHESVNRCYPRRLIPLANPSFLFPFPDCRFFFFFLEALLDTTCVTSC